MNIPFTKIVRSFGKTSPLQLLTLGANMGAALTDNDALDNRAAAAARLARPAEHT